MKKPRGAPGTVYLVGAGPGAHAYLTLRAAQLLAEADVVVYDALVGEGILTRFAPQARAIDVGKKAGRHTVPQEEISALLPRLARRHRTVVRLKGGDPTVFGRGAEEAEVLARAGVPFEVVPGLTAAQGAAATAGIPLTHRARNAAVTLVTGHEDPTKEASTLDYGALARVGALVFYMGVGRLEAIARALVERGLDPATPAALVQEATLPGQRTVRAPLASIAARAAAEGIRPPALLFVGANAAEDAALDWFSTRPLFGRTVVVTRARAQASVLTERLQALGARVVESPAIEIRPVRGAERDRVDRACRGLRRFDVVVFTSVNGVEVFLERIAALGLDGRAFAGALLAAVGPATAKALADAGLRADFVPARFTTEALGAALAGRRFPKGTRVLLARAREANPALSAALRARSWRVTELPLYDTAPHRRGAQALRTLLKGGEASYVTFTSSSTVRFFRDRAGARNFAAFAARTRTASIGPVTSDTLRSFGVEPDVEAAEHTIPGLVEAILDDARGRPGPPRNPTQPEVL